jgi:hypothetical protein
MMGRQDVRLGARGRVQLHYEARSIDVFFTLDPFSVTNVLLGGVGDRRHDDPSPTYVFAGVFPARLQRIGMQLVYAGMLEGVPTREMNRKLIERYLKEARSEVKDIPVHLVDPTETPIELGRPYPFGTPASLPSVVATALFRSRSCAHNEALDGSVLSVVWFQTQMAMPNSSTFNGVDWRALAVDEEW